MKLSKFKQLTKRVEDLSKEIWRHEPPKPYIMFWKWTLLPDRELKVQRFYSREDMANAKDFIIGSSNPKNFTFYLTKELTPTPKGLDKSV